MSEIDYDQIIPTLANIFDSSVEAKLAEWDATPAEWDEGLQSRVKHFTVTPKDAKPSLVSDSDRAMFEEFMEPYGELLGLFSPDARCDSDWIGFNLTLMHRKAGRLLSPFEVLRGSGVEIVVHSGEIVDKRPDSHSIVISMDAQPDTLARVATVLAKYGLIPENFTTTRRGADRMNLVLEIIGEDITPAAVEKFVASLQQKLITVDQGSIRYFSRPPSRRLDDNAELSMA